MVFSSTGFWPSTSTTVSSARITRNRQTRTSAIVPRCTCTRSPRDKCSLSHFDSTARPTSRSIARSLIECSPSNAHYNLNRSLDTRPVTFTAKRAQPSTSDTLMICPERVHFLLLLCFSCGQREDTRSSVSRRERGPFRSDGVRGGTRTRVKVTRGAY